MLSWEKYLITHAELNINLVIITIIFPPGFSFDQIHFGLFYHILSFRNPWLSSLNRMQTFNQIEWSSQYLTKHQLLWTGSTAILHTCINSKLNKKEEVPPTYSIRGLIQSTSISKSVQLYDVLFQPNHQSTDNRHL